MAPSSTEYDQITLTGGLDLLTPTLSLRPGYVRDALNWETSVNSGYTRCGQYERFDGHPSPSLAQYLTVTVNITGALVVGSSINGQTSGATGLVISITGAVVAFTFSTGTFVVGENVRIGVTVVGVVTAEGGVGSANDYGVTQLALAADAYRPAILAVPGSGSVRGVAYLGGTLYAWRDNVGATALAIYKHSGAGWVLVPALYEVSFTAGTTAYAVGSTLTQGGVSATIKQVALQSGTFAGGTAAGRFIITNPSGGNFGAGAAAGGGVATLSGIQTVITYLPGGRVQTDTGNFGAAKKIYGCDGVNRGFEFDGVTMAPITTGNSPDVPQCVQVHKDHLWFAFGTNYQNSGITTPFNWTAVAGSAAFRAPDTVTAIIRQSGDQSTGALTISTLSTTSVMYGSSAANFQPVDYEESAGARPYGAQRVGAQSLLFGDTGIFSVRATQSFGNFVPNTLTMNIRPFTQVRRSLCTASVTNREKSQYRVFFSDGNGLFMTIVNGRVLGTMPVQFANPVTCACRGTTPDGTETQFFGSTNGFVYQLDVGTSQDGAAINAYLTMTYAHQRNPRIYKAYRGASFEVQGDTYAEFNVTYDLSYGGTRRPQGVSPTVLTAKLSRTYWDSFYWDAFFWDGRTLGPSDCRIKGTGVNIALRIDSTSAKFAPFTLNSVILHYLRRKAIKK